MDAPQTLHVTHTRVTPSSPLFDYLFDYLHIDRRLSKIDLEDPAVLAALQQVQEETKFMLMTYLVRLPIRVFLAVEIL